MDDQNNVKRAAMEELFPLLSEQLKQGGSVRLTVTGNSMYPLFRGGVDSVVLTAAKKIKKYDIPLYRRKDGSFVLHRVVREKNGVYTLLGDNQLLKETPIYADQMLAVVKGFYRGRNYTPCTKLWYRFYARVWTAFIPMRPALLKCALKLRRATMRRDKKQENGQA